MIDDKENKINEYIVVNGIKVNKSLYEDCKRISMGFKCPKCKNKDNQLLAIITEDVININCSKCGNPLTYGINQKPMRYTWDYLIRNDITNEEYELMKLGKLGWELVTVLVHKSEVTNSSAYVKIFYFKRYIKDE